MRREAGELKTTGDSSFYQVKGFYSFVSPDGRRVTVIYTADENGFQPKVIEKLSNETIKGEDRLHPDIIKTLLGGG